MPNLWLLKCSKLLVLLSLTITICYVIFIINPNFTIHNILYNQFLGHMENISTCIPQVQNISSINGSSACTGKELQHEHIFQRRDPKKLKFQLSEIQRTILDPGLTRLAVIQMEGLQDIDHQAAGWAYPRISSKVTVSRHIADLY